MRPDYIINYTILTIPAHNILSLWIYHRRFGISSPHNSGDGTAVRYKHDNPDDVTAEGQNNMLKHGFFYIERALKMLDVDTGKAVNYGQDWVNDPQAAVRGWQYHTVDRAERSIPLRSTAAVFDGKQLCRQQAYDSWAAGSAAQVPLPSSILSDTAGFGAELKMISIYKSLISMLSQCLLPQLQY